MIYAISTGQGVEGNGEEEKEALGIYIQVKEIRVFIWETKLKVYLIKI